MPIFSQEELDGEPFEDTNLITIVESLPGPASVRKGQLYYAKDTGLYWYSTGTAWRGPLRYSGDGHAIRPNILVNSSFWLAQSQAPATLTSYGTGGLNRSISADQWAITTENASTDYQRGDARVTPQTGLAAPYFARLKKITNAGKIVFSQVLIGADIAPLRGKQVRLQFKGKNETGSHALRLVLLQLTSSGTLDTIPNPFVSAFGSAGTDPTWGTNLAAITPDSADFPATVDGAGLDCPLSSSWLTFGGAWTIPSNCLNLVVVIFTDGQPAVDDAFLLGEPGLYEGAEVRQWRGEPESEQLARAQRFLFKTFDLETAPASNIGAGTGEFQFPATVAGANSQRSPESPFAVRMFKLPTIVRFNPGATGQQVRDNNVPGNTTVTSDFNLTERGVSFLFTGHASTAVGNSMRIHYVAIAYP